MNVISQQTDLTELPFEDLIQGLFYSRWIAPIRDEWERRATADGKTQIEYFLETLGRKPPPEPETGSHFEDEELPMHYDNPPFDEDLLDDDTLLREIHRLGTIPAIRRHLNTKELDGVDNGPTQWSRYTLSSRPKARAFYERVYRHIKRLESEIMAARLSST